MTNKKHKKKFGFTLIELLITIFIMVLLVTLFIPYKRQFAKNNDLKASMQSMKEAIYKTQSLAYAPASSYNYYRFAFYPNQNPIPFQVFGGIEKTTNPSNFIIDPNEKSIEKGLLSSDISFDKKSGNSISLNNQETIVFIAPNGNCILNNQSGIITYTFQLSSDNNKKSSINFDANTCSVNIK